MSWTRVVAYNLLITLVLLLVLEFGLKTMFYIKDAAAKEESAKQTPQPNHTEDVTGFFSEVKNFRGYPYKAFLGWVSPDTSGEFLNVKDGKRLTVLPEVLDADHTIHFFGGSTMWGYSVSDKNTLPSLVANLLKTKTVNHGEQAYNSRQALNLLVDNIDHIQEGDQVFFYDGVNDIYHNCLSRNSWNGHAREFYIKDVLSNGRDGNAIPAWLDSLSIYRFAKGLALKMQSTSGQVKTYHNACTDPHRAEQVASFLVNNWRTAEALLNSKGVEFVCALQPNPYTFAGKTAYFNREWHDEIRAVYPLIQSKAQDLSCFVDYSESLTEDYYTDACCHLNEIGNAQMAEVIADSLRTSRLMQSAQK